MGTKNGAVHKCSCSYHEQYLDTHSGHGGPLYRVRCSPVAPTSALLSCSADWTAKYPSIAAPRPALQAAFRASDLAEAVSDVHWSPTSSTAFALATRDGLIEVRNLAESPMDPAAFMFNDGAVNSTFEDEDDPEARNAELPAQTAISFSPTTTVLMAGDEGGRVRAYEVADVNLRPAGVVGIPPAQAARLAVAMKTGP